MEGVKINKKQALKLVNKNGWAIKSLSNSFKKAHNFIIYLLEKVVLLLGS